MVQFRAKKDANTLSVIHEGGASMKITTQPSGTALSDEEMKNLTALLVKLGYTVRIGRERILNKSTLRKVILAEEEKV